MASSTIHAGYALLHNYLLQAWERSQLNLAKPVEVIHIQMVKRQTTQT